MTIVLLGIGVGILGCGDDQDPEGASDLWDRIHEADYRSWARAPGWETTQPTSAPHADDVDIYVNPVVSEALAGPGGLSAWPEGSIIVKDGFSDGELDQVAAMEKGPDKWFWAEWDDEGESIFSGDPETCTDCHASGDDYVRAFALP